MVCQSARSRARGFRSSFGVTSAIFRLHVVLELRILELTSKEAPSRVGYFQHELFRGSLYEY